MMSWYKPIKIAHRVIESVRGATNDKPPVIFMHGLTESKETWRRVPDRVATKTRRKAYAFDARNHGESQHTMVSRFNNNLYDLYHFMDTMKIDKAVLVGHSMGGMTAVKAALDQPSRVESVFIVNMHTDEIKAEVINRWLYYLLRQADAQCMSDSNKPNLALVHRPPPLEELKKDKTLHNSVALFRSLALSDALLEFDAAQLTTHLNGTYDGTTYFIFGPMNALCGKRLYTMNHMKFFPNSDVIAMMDYSSDLFKDGKLAEVIGDKILEYTKISEDD